MRRSALSATLLTALAACGGTPANQAAQAPGQPPAQISIDTPQGHTEVSTGPGAAAWPDGIPPYPGAAAGPNVNISGAGAQGSGRILGFRTGDPAEQVIGFYADAAGRAGYRVLTRATTGANATLILEKDGGVHVSINATRVGDFTQAQIVVAGPAPGR